MTNVVPLHRSPLFRRVVVAARDGRAHIFLAGPLWGGKPRPLRWVGEISADDRGRLRRRVRRLAEHFALDLIDDMSGCIDPARGPVVYSLSKATGR
jgi:hypothetical protein